MVANQPIMMAGRSVGFASVPMPAAHSHPSIPFIPIRPHPFTSVLIQFSSAAAEQQQRRSLLTLPFLFCLPIAITAHTANNNQPSIHSFMPCPCQSVNSVSQWGRSMGRSVHVLSRVMGAPAGRSSYRRWHCLLPSSLAHCFFLFPSIHPFIRPSIHKSAANPFSSYSAIAAAISRSVGSSSQASFHPFPPLVAFASNSAVACLSLLPTSDLAGPFPTSNLRAATRTGEWHTHNHGCCLLASEARPIHPINDGDWQIDGGTHCLPRLLLF